MKIFLKAFESIWVAITFAQHGILPPDVMLETTSVIDETLAGPAFIAQ